MIAGVSSPIEMPDSMLRSTKKDNKGRHCSQTALHTQRVTVPISA